jgi:hypothetical protein
MACSGERPSLISHVLHASAVLLMLQRLWRPFYYPPPPPLHSLLNHNVHYRWMKH